MNWLAWVGIVYLAVIGFDVAFISVIVTVDTIRDWRSEREKRRRS